MSTINILPLGEAKEIWDKVLTSTKLPMPMFSFEWYSSWISINNQEWQPYILLINNTTLAPFVRKGEVVQFAHAYTDFNDLIGPVENIWPLVLEFLKQAGIKRLELENIMEGSATVSFFQAFFENHKNGSITAAKTAPFLTLPNTFESYISTIKSKRRKYHKFQRDYPNTTILKSNQPEKDIDTLITLMKIDPTKILTPQKEAFFKTIALDCKPYIWMQLLKVENEIIGILYMFIDNKSVRLYINGCNKEKYPNVGNYLIIETIKEAIGKGYEEFSFLIGPESYKYELGAQDFSLYSVTLDL